MKSDIIIMIITMKNMYAHLIEIKHDLPTDGLNMPIGSPTPSCLTKSSANAFVNVYVFGQPDVKLKYKYFH